MQRILQINIAGRIIPVEEDAYNMLKDYLTRLERQFAGEEGREIVEDIEYRIAELFTIRLENGTPAINRADVQKVIDTLGSPADLHDGPSQGQGYQQGRSQTYTGNMGKGYQQYRQRHERLLRDPFDKVIGGVCSGIAHYFDIDPVIVRISMVVLFLTFGIGFLAYIIAWAVIPAARSREELYYGQPMTFHDISRNMQAELDDLKRRGEEMSRDLRDFFSRKR